MKLPYGSDRASSDKARTNSYLSKAGYARGGRVEDEGTKINITIGAPPGGAPGGAGGGPPPALLSALAQAAKPPMPPEMPAPGPGGPPTMPAPGGFKKGGLIGKGTKTYADMDAGALGGMGRIEKTAIAKKAR